MPLTPEEQLALQSLLEKAKSGSAMESSSNCSDGGFSLVSELMPMGAMSDGSKRREDSTPVEVTVKKMGLSTGPATMVSSEMLPNPVSGYVSEPVLAGPFPLSAQESCEIKIAFPPHVHDLETWGRTLITWGKYKSENMSYADLMQAQDERAMTYKTWCRQRVKSAEGHLLDFTRYLLLCDRLQGGPDLKQGPLIPGTSDVRRFK